MKPLLLISLTFLTLLISCNSNTPINSKSIKDSILAEYLQTRDSLPYFDTTDIHYKVLKAYQINDTTFFKHLHSEIELERKQRDYQFADTCVHLTKLSDLNVDEAYRFIFTAPFCFYKINTTVTKKADSMNLHFILYMSRIDTRECKIVSEFDKKLTQKNWDDIEFELDAADIWGLKRENGKYGLDGSTTIFMGYKKGDNSSYRPTKTTYVDRWSQSSLREPLSLILKISGNKQGCYWVQ